VLDRVGFQGLEVGCGDFVGWHSFGGSAMKKKLDPNWYAGYPRQWIDENGEVCRPASLRATLVMVGVMLFGAVGMVMFVIHCLRILGLIK